MWDDRKQLDSVSTAIVTMTALALCCAALAWLVRQPAFAFREVVIGTTLVHTSGVHLETAIREELSGTFFSMDLDQSRAALKRVPWVRNVALRRQWPAKLEVTIEEHVPLARWNDRALVNVQHEIFSADYDAELPRFNGPDERAREVAERYREWSRVVAPLGFAIDEVSVTARGGWRLNTTRKGASLALELGRDEPGVRLARFVAAYGRTVGALARSGTSIEHVDLRYRNGFAARVPGFRERAQKKPT